MGRSCDPTRLSFFFHSSVFIQSRRSPLFFFTMELSRSPIPLEKCLFFFLSLNFRSRILFPFFLCSLFIFFFGLLLFFSLEKPGPPLLSVPGCFYNTFFSFFFYFVLCRVAFLPLFFPCPRPVESGSCPCQRFLMLLLLRIARFLFPHFFICPPEHNGALPSKGAGPPPCGGTGNFNFSLFTLFCATKIRSCFFSFFFFSFLVGGHFPLFFLGSGAFLFSPD